MTARTSTIAILTVAVTAVGAYAHGGATGVVKERMDMMKSISSHMKTVGDMVKGETAFDAGQVTLAAEAIAAHADGIPEKFPEGSLHDPSEALPSVWENWEVFVARADDMKASALTLSLASADATGVGDIRIQFVAVGKTCSSCHTDFRKAN
jgi:cytochrome c556